MSARENNGSVDSFLANAVNTIGSWAFGLLVLLWASGLLIFFLVLPFASPNLMWALGGGGGLVLILNSACILGMTKRVFQDPVGICEAGPYDQLRK